jgi:hypothetical protein
MASPEMQKLAHHIVALETAHDNSSDAREASMHTRLSRARVIRKLGMLLIRLAGVDGLRALLSRALALAKSEAPALGMVHVGADGSLVGFEGIAQSIEQSQKAEASRAGRDRPHNSHIGTAGDLHWRIVNAGTGA